MDLDLGFRRMGYSDSMTSSGRTFLVRLFITVEVRITTKRTHCLSLLVFYSNALLFTLNQRSVSLLPAYVSLTNKAKAAVAESPCPVAAGCLSLVYYLHRLQHPPLSSSPYSSSTILLYFLSLTLSQRHLWDRAHKLLCQASPP